MHDAIREMATTITPTSDEDSAVKLAREIFLTNAGPALVKRAADALLTRGIPVMPLKGVLLQKLVYREGPFRPIADVDLLVPEERFFEACALLKTAGFSRSHWERGRWQVTLTNPAGPPFGIDLHRRLTRTYRARLTSQGLFQRGTLDMQIFAAPVIIPAPDDLFAHLLLHATLHWLTTGRLHRPRDFQAVAGALALDTERCAAHLAQQGLLPHAVLMLPLISAAGDAPFAVELLGRLPHGARARAGAWLARAIAARFEVNHPTRRLAGLALTPSLTATLISAARDRIESKSQI